MTVRVRLFARARDLAGADVVNVELPAGGTYMITTSVKVRTKLLDADPLPVSAA